jgi:hypothetical protein
LITQVQRLYEVWAADSELRNALGQSLDPRGPEWLFQVFAELGPRRGDLVLDAGGGVLLAYVTHATDRLEPAETDELVRRLALQRSSLDPAHLETAAGEAGLALRSVERLRSEWRERLLGDADWDVSRDLVKLARLRRREPQLVELYGAAAIDAAAGGLAWGVYQLLGKLCPTVYVWERRA